MNVQRVDPLGNLWYIDPNAKPPTIGTYDPASQKIQNAEIQLEKMTGDIDLSTLKQITFRDGYVFALCNVGILVWEGDI